MYICHVFLCNQPVLDAFGPASHWFSDSIAVKCVRLSFSLVSTWPPFLGAVLTGLPSISCPRLAVCDFRRPLVVFQADQSRWFIQGHEMDEWRETCQSEGRWSRLRASKNEPFSGHQKEGWDRKYESFMYERTCP